MSNCPLYVTEGLWPLHMRFLLLRPSSALGTPFLCSAIQTPDPVSLPHSGTKHSRSEQGRWRARAGPLCCQVTGPVGLKSWFPPFSPRLPLIISLLSLPNSFFSSRSTVLSPKSWHLQPRCCSSSACCALARGSLLRRVRFSPPRTPTSRRRGTLPLPVRFRRGKPRCRSTSAASRRGTSQ